MPTLSGQFVFHIQHHHVNVADFEIGNTKLITNQLGYIKYNENTGFNDKAIISI
ncbi:hypothetical protein [Flavobacterium piscisymbiosum]|uniref:Uncharacterized protein n=1 Tax=Flavobacterium piscisymbiosum TaxID=2893753 RepID=A0ABS8ME32_9FLAO|nr:hypothetical protein [Flavobacterium sp. F-30]MCC9063731.1 hypothetical protein [Flavobacterium sp. F-30]